MLKELERALKKYGSTAALAGKLVDDRGLSPAAGAVVMWKHRGVVPYRWRDPLKAVLIGKKRKR